MQGACFRNRKKQKVVVFLFILIKMEIKSVLYINLLVQYNHVETRLAATSIKQLLSEKTNSSILHTVHSILLYKTTLFWLSIERGVR